MNHLNTIMLTIGVITSMIIIERHYKPRFDITDNSDFVVWYYNREGERVFKILFHIN
jgi:hypothetical protein